MNLLAIDSSVGGVGRHRNRLLGAKCYQMVFWERRAEASCRLSLNDTLSRAAQYNGLCVLFLDWNQ